MALNFSELLYAPIYTALGVPVAFVLASAQVIEIVCLDKTAGLEVTEGHSGVQVQTVKPAAVMRMTDLLSISLAPDDLMDAVCEINGTSWKVRSYYPKPSPSGQDDGELYLILVAAP